MLPNTSHKYLNPTFNNQNSKGDNFHALNINHHQAT